MDCACKGEICLKLVHKGKAKDVYEIDNNTYLFHFSDRISAFDVEMPVLIPKKGEVLCQFAKFWFDTLDVENHMLATRDLDKMIVKKLKMIPLEFVVRGYFYGSLVERYTKNQAIYPSLRKLKPMLASRLPEPIFDPTTKSDIHDIPITEDQITRSEIISREELTYIKKKSISLYRQMTTIAGHAGFIVADTKFEFGHDTSGSLIILADSLGPDEFRLWRKSDYMPGKVQESYDKQILRDWLISTGFKEIIDEESRKGLKPTAPSVPPEIVSRLSRRYIYAYEKISNIKFRSKT
jgi:phosphoribosylaminoimidazole-succinocarboxamide synthase